VKHTLRTLTLIIAGLLSCQGVIGQGFNPGDRYISGGFGLLNLNAGVIKGDDITARSLGPIYLKFEAGVSKHIGMGLNLSYLQVTGQVPVYSDSAVHDSFGTYYPVTGFKKGVVYWTDGIQLRVNIHFVEGKMVDPYWGVGMGYRGGRWNRKFAQWAEEGPVYHLGLATSVGVRVYFIPQLAGYVELGTEKALLQLGLTYRIGENKSSGG
jgi:hypothetical protein